MRVLLLWGMCCVVAFLFLGFVLDSPRHGPFGIYMRVANFRPVPGQRIETGGTSVFVRDPSIDHPIQPPTVPALSLLAIEAAGMGIMVVMEWLVSRSCGACEKSLRVVATVLLALASNELATDLAKYYCGVLRPNFYAGCRWSDEQLACTAPLNIDLEFRKSFPSGHSSVAGCMAALLTRHTLIHVDHARVARAPVRQRVLQVMLLLPVPSAIFVAASRVHDNWHHPSDVLAGLLLGSLVALFVHTILWSPVPVGSTHQARPAADEAESKPLV